MEVVDLFGHRERAPKPVRSRARHTEVFDLGNDLSPAERFIVASHMNDRSMEIRRDSPWWDKRSREKAQRLAIESDRYCNCGHQVVDLYCPKDGQPYYVRSFCKSRICETCGRIYKKKIQRKFQPTVDALYERNARHDYFLSLLTLTVTTKRFGPKLDTDPELALGQAPLRFGSNDLPSREDIERLYRETAQFFRLYYGKYKARRTEKGEVVEVLRPYTPVEKDERRAIAKLRRQAKKNGEPLPEFPKPDRRIPIHSGWLAVIELGKDNNNIHCHAIVYGPYTHWQKLRSSWEGITGDSHQVDIRKVTSAKALSEYVLKYITKPPQTENYQRVADYAVMIKGTRRIRSGGLFYGMLTLDKPEHRDCNCPECGTRLVMRGIILKIQAVHHIDLYEELRQIEAGRVTGYNPDVPPNFLPRGVTPVYMPQRQGHC
jgi:predicted nucleic acid-binding protein